MDFWKEKKNTEKVDVVGVFMNFSKKKKFKELTWYSWDCNQSSFKKNIGTLIKTLLAFEFLNLDTAHETKRSM